MYWSLNYNYLMEGQDAEALGVYMSLSKVPNGMKHQKFQMQGTLCCCVAQSSASIYLFMGG